MQTGRRVRLALTTDSVKQIQDSSSAMQPIYLLQILGDEAARTAGPNLVRMVLADKKEVALLG